MSVNRLILEIGVNEGKYFLTFDLDCYPFDEEEYANSTTLSNVNTLFVHFNVQVIYSFQCCSSTQQLFRTSTTYSFFSALFSYGTFLVGHDRNAYSLHTPYFQGSEMVKMKCSATSHRREVLKQIVQRLTFAQEEGR